VVPPKFVCKTYLITHNAVSAMSSTQLKDLLLDYLHLPFVLLFTNQKLSTTSGKTTPSIPRIYVYSLC